MEPRFFGNLSVYRHFERFLSLYTDTDTIYYVCIYKK
nr:MAG TPA: hypothetical protein [Caudoviricetes sp.]